MSDEVGFKQKNFNSKKKPNSIISPDTSENTSTHLEKKSNQKPKVDIESEDITSVKESGSTEKESSKPEVEEEQNSYTEKKQKDHTEKGLKNDKEKDSDYNLPKKKKNGLSLKSIQYKKNHEKNQNENQDPKEVLDQEFSLEDLKSCWIKFAEIIDKKGEKLLASTLLSDIPKLEDKNIVLNMPNDTMKIELLHNKSRILDYIGNVLKNNQLDLQINVSPSEHKKYVHTSEEKYRHFVEINPKVEILKQRLDLDF